MVVKKENFMNKTGLLLSLLLVFAWSCHALLEFNWEKTINGMDSPSDVMVASDGRIYVADSGGPATSTVRVFNANYSFAQRIGAWGSDAYSFIFPRGVFKNDDGKLYVADTGNNRLQIYNPSGGHYKTIGDSGSETDAYTFTSPSDAFIDRGVLYVPDVSNKVYAYNTTNQIYWGLIGVQGGRVETLLDNPSAVHAIGGKVYIADTGNNRIAVFTDYRNGSYSYEASFGRGLGGVNLNRPEGVFVTSDGRAFVSDTGNNRIIIFKPDYSPEALINANASKNLTFKTPRGLWVSEGKLFVANSGNGSVLVIKITERITASRETAEAKKNEANEKITEALELKNVATTNSISVNAEIENELTLARTFNALANESFNALEYSAALDNATSSLLHSTNAFTQLDNALDTVTSNEYTESTGRMAAIEKTISTFNLKFDTAKTKAKLREMNSAITAKNYSRAFELAPQTREELVELEVGIDAETKGMKTLKQNAEANLTQAKNNFARITELNEAYKQELNLTETEEEIKQAEYALSTYAFGSAHDKAEKANAETTKTLASLEEKKKKIDEALQKINDSKKIIEGTQPFPVPFIGPNLNDAQAKLAQAQQLAYTQPEQALQLAAQAQQAASAKPPEADAATLAVILCPTAVLLAILAAAIIIYKKYKQLTRLAPPEETEEEKLVKKATEKKEKRKLKL